MSDYNWSVTAVYACENKVTTESIGYYTMDNGFAQFIDYVEAFRIGYEGYEWHVSLFDCSTNKRCCYVTSYDFR